MNSIGYAVVALVFFGLVDFAYKRAADAGARPHHFLMAQAMFFAPSTYVIAWAFGVLGWNPYMLFGALAGLFSYVSFYCFSRSLIGGAVSLNAPLFRLNFLVTAALAIVFLGEPLTLWKAAGLVCALVAAWLLVGGAVRADALSSPKLRASLLLAVVASLTFGIANFCHKIGLMHGVPPQAMLVGQVTVFMPATVLGVLALDRRIAVPVKTFGFGLAAAVFLLGAFVAFLIALRSGEASVVTPIAQMGFIVTAALGVTMLREPITARKAVGLVFALAALGAFAL